MMDSDEPDCGPLHEVYAAARVGDRERVRRAWGRARPAIEPLESRAAQSLAEAVDDGEPTTAQREAAALLFREEQPPAIDGVIGTTIGRILYVFGYLASFVLFFRARSAATVVRRLRWAYRTVGVDVYDTETVDGVERTTFRCPYRNFGADRHGQRRVCHDVLDRVDDGYVTFLDRHRDIDYQRPRACAASECCYSEVAER